MGFLVETPKEEATWEASEDNIKTDLREIRCQDINCIRLARVFFEYLDEPSGTIKGGNFLAR
jgi:hypothetical protein